MAFCESAAAYLCTTVSKLTSERGFALSSNSTGNKILGGIFVAVFLPFCGLLAWNWHRRR